MKTVVFIGEGTFNSKVRMHNHLTIKLCGIQRRIQNPVKYLSKMDFFAKVVNGFSPLIIFGKCSFLDVWQNPEYVCGIWFTQ